MVSRENILEGENLKLRYVLPFMLFVQYLRKNNSRLGGAAQVMAGEVCSKQRLFTSW